MRVPSMFDPKPALHIGNCIPHIIYKSVSAVECGYASIGNNRNFVSSRSKSASTHRLVAHLKISNPMLNEYSCFLEFPAIKKINTVS